MKFASYITKTKTRKAVGHQFISHIFGILLRFGGNLITTRLLLPDLFGIMFVANSIYLGLSLFSDVGIKQSIIRSEFAASVAFQRTAWVMQIFRSVLQFILSLCVALVFYIFYQAEILQNSVYSTFELPVATIFVGLWLLVQGFQSIKIPLLMREMKFAAVSYYLLLRDVLGVAATVVWAFYAPSIYALCAAPLVTMTVSVLLSLFIFKSEGNRLEFDKAHAQEILQFGKWLMASSGMEFLGRHGARMLVGIYLSPREMGYLAIASTLIEAFRSLFARMSSVMFSRLSEVRRTEGERYSQRYYNLKFYRDVLIYFLFGMILVSATSIIQVLYDERFAGVGPILQILSIQFIMMSFQIQTKALMAIGNPRAVAVAKGITAICTLSAIPIAYRIGGMQGCIFAMAGVPCVSILIQTLYLNPIIRFDWRRELLPTVSFIPGAGAGYAIVRLSMLVPS